MSSDEKSIQLYGREPKDLIDNGYLEYAHQKRPCVTSAGFDFEEGDILWVQEPHARTEKECIFTNPHYFSDGELTIENRHDAGLLQTYTAIGMPKWASRIKVKVTNITKGDNGLICVLELIK